MKYDTLFQQENTHKVNDLMKDPEAVAALSVCAAQLNSGEYPLSYKDLVFQKWRVKAADIYDAGPFGAIHAAIRTGQIAIAQIDVGATPCRDKNIDGNNALLGNLPDYVTGEFWGGTQGADGQITLLRPIHCVVIDPERKEQRWGLLGRGPYNLEIGYTCAAKTFMQVFAELGLARWPYGHKVITIMSRYYVNSQSDNFHSLLDLTPDSPLTAINPWTEWNSWRN